MAFSKAVLLSADRGHILKALATFSGKPTSRWLSGTSPAAKGTLPANWLTVQKMDPNKVIEATAAAAPNHCIDGWGYAARAISALLAGDLHAARHLAYYAQLRAGLSMLGNVGIGIFNGINFSVDSIGAIHRLDASKKPSKRGFGTHEAVWEALSAWVSSPQTARQFLELVRIGNSSLGGCIDAVWPGSSAASVAGTLIAACGLDLMRGRDEHTARNMSSYNPQAFEQIPDKIGERLDYIEGVWNLFEPTATSHFDKLDRYLLRSVLWQQHELVATGKPKKKGAIARRYGELPDGVRRIASQDFLLGNTEQNEPQLVQLSRATTKPALPLEMTSRALLLLRAATAFTVSNFNDAGVRSGSGRLRPWLDPIAISRGFLEPSTPTAELADLWADVKIGLEQLSMSKRTPPSSLHSWVQHGRSAIPVICEAERIGVWSLGS